MTFLSDSRVAVTRGGTRYPVPPFNPPEAYAELEALGLCSRVDPANHVYSLVRDAFRQLELDADHDGTPAWNPLGQIVRPGDHVLIKPNWVRERRHQDQSWEHIMTHGAVIRPVIDYVQIALRGTGTISLADGPILNADFSEICRKAGVDSFSSLYRACLPVEVFDLRQTFFEIRNDVIVDRRRLPGDPRGAVTVDLGAASLFHGFRGEGQYFGADYDTDEVNRHHAGERHEYLLSSTAVGADVIIDVPKLKTHSKVGVTLALKGVVGLNAGRNWLPHHTQGTPGSGGDQFANSGLRQRAEYMAVRAFERASLRLPGLITPLFRFAKSLGKPVFGASAHTVRSGGWWGNDTLWRTVLDINRALLYSDVHGALHPQPTKRRFVVVDGIVAGEGMGPLFADARGAGVILAGSNPAAVDLVGAELMGFDYQRISSIAEAFDLERYRIAEFAPDDIRVTSAVEAWSGPIDRLRRANPFEFVPPAGWRNYMERTGLSRHVAAS